MVSVKFSWFGPGAARLVRTRVHARRSPPLLSDVRSDPARTEDVGDHDPHGLNERHRWSPQVVPQLAQGSRDIGEGREADRWDRSDNGRDNMSNDTRASGGDVDDEHQQPAGDWKEREQPHVSDHGPVPRFGLKRRHGFVPAPRVPARLTDWRWLGHAQKGNPSQSVPNARSAHCLIDGWRQRCACSRRYPRWFRCTDTPPPRKTAISVYNELIQAHECGCLDSAALGMLKIAKWRSSR